MEFPFEKIYLTHLPMNCDERHVLQLQMAVFLDAML